jgi:SAM-dependent methyltransferase
MPVHPCKKCRSESTLLFRAGDYNRRITSELFDYYRCDACHLIFLDPIPADLGAYYPNHYYEIPKSVAELTTVAEKLQSWKLELVKRHIQKGRLLEIGPAYGLFCHLARRAGFEVSAIEMDPRCCQFLRDVVGINVFQGADTVTKLRECGQFDVIVLWQVIEHLPDPWSVLAAIAGQLAPGGILIMDTPNPSAFQFQVLGRYWTHVDAPRHVELIPARLLEGYVQAMGLETVVLTSQDRSSIGFNSFGWAFSFKNFFATPVLQAIAHFTGRVVTKLLIPIERSGWRGSTYTAVFRKKRP